MRAGGLRGVSGDGILRYSRRHREWSPVALHPLLDLSCWNGILHRRRVDRYFFGMAPALAVMVVASRRRLRVRAPYLQLGALDQSDVGLIVSLPLVSMLVIGLIERLRRSEFRAELIALVAQSRYEMLLRADNERAITSRRALDETHRLIRNLPGCHDDTISSKPAALCTGMRYEHLHSNNIKPPLVHTRAWQQPSH